MELTLEKSRPEPAFHLAPVSGLKGGTRPPDGLMELTLEKSRPEAAFHFVAVPGFVRTTVRRRAATLHSGSP